MTATARGANPLAGLIILLVEDEFLIALDAQDILVEIGVARVEMASTLELARTMLDGARVDLAVFDLNINGEMSFRVAELFAARGIPVVFASGYQLKQPPILNGTPVPCLNKPYTTEGLRNALVASLAAKPGRNPP